MKYLKAFNTHSEYQTYINRGNTVLPNVSICREEGDVHYNEVDYSKMYLTTVARESGTISFNIWYSMGTDMITSISYSTNGGKTWVTTENLDDKEEHLVIDVDVNEGDEVMWKGIASLLGYYSEEDIDEDIGSFFSSDCQFDAKGNIMSMLYGDNFKSLTTIEENYAFCSLFSDWYNEEKSCNIVNAKDLSLPATTLADYCYEYMFTNCTSLLTAPKLPATTLANYCYYIMFQNCTSLKIAPELPATTLADACYEGMFRGCTSLVTAPALPATTLELSCYYQMFYGCTSLTEASELPATTLEDYCYYSMFQNCTSLTTAPELPATILTTGCYYNMFSGCTSLTTVPELPATTLTTYCYTGMFLNCTSLNYIKAMFTTTPSTTYTFNWVSDVAASGTFVKNSAAEWNVSGANGIPTGWTVETATS